MPRFLRGLGFALILAGALGGCAAQSDRTRDLLELGLADRDAAIARLEAEDQAAPAAWRAYSLGVLHAAGDDFAGMDRWFAVCAQRDDGLYADRMTATRRESWRRWARQADAAFADGRWAEAARACSLALAADPTGHPDTELRAMECMVMASGPTAAAVAVLSDAGRTAVLDRWLEAVQAGAVDRDVVDRAEADLAAAPVRPAGAFVLGELARLGGHLSAMARWYAAAGARVDGDHRSVMTSNREASRGRLLADALAAWEAGDQAGCLAALDTAGVVAPGDDDVAAARTHAVALGEAGDAGAIDRVLVDPTLDDAWLEAWLTRLRATGRPADAAQVAGALLAPGRKTDPAVADRARRARAACLVETGAWDAAAAELRALLDASDDAATAVALGDVLLAGSRWDAAADAYHRAEALAGPSASLHKRLARAAFGAGRWDDLRAELDQALALAPADAEALQLKQQADRLAAALPGTEAP